MQNRLTILSGFLILLCSIPGPASGFGSMGPIAASVGDSEFFCAIAAAGGNQEVLCWGGRNASSAAATIPAMFALSGGEGFLCGISSNTSRAFCWTPIGPSSSSDLVPPEFRTTAYSAIAAGTSHACAVRGPYYSDDNSGTVDCWEIVRTESQTLTSKTSPSTTSLAFKTVVAGDGFTCGDARDGGVFCWGPNSGDLRIPASLSVSSLAASKSSLCAVSEATKELRCWGSYPPAQTRFVSLSAGSSHFCGIREDTHGVECWGSHSPSTAPKSPGFRAIASSDRTSCGIREDDLVLDCWPANGDDNSIEPPLELCSPGVCSPGTCGSDQFAYNASVLNEPDLTSLCLRKDLKICSPCGTACLGGLFLSSACTAASDRVCTPCSLCQNTSCRAVCGLKRPDDSGPIWRHLRRAALLAGISIFGLLFAVVFVCLVVAKKRNRQGKPGGGKVEQIDAEGNSDFSNAADPPPSFFPGAAQVFRLSELKDATNGFKEFNELGRGGYGFVYKALLADGRQVAVKRANAATIIRSNSRDFEAELETLCKVRHCNIVNLLGYCCEMGERLLVYEYMPHGTLFDHLHGGLSPLNWTLRLRISAQAARGLEYLHKEFGLGHRDVKSSNILIDADWAARVADFGLVKDPNVDLGSDVYAFGVVLLEILSGRKAFDRDCDPPSVVEWARPLIEQGKAAAIIDRYVALPRNVEPLLRLADVVEMATRENPNRRPGISEIACSLEQIVKDGLIL